MKYKVMCEISFPSFEKSIDVTLPINKTVGYVCAMLDTIIKENIYAPYIPKQNSILVNKRTGTVYDKNKLIVETDIRNGCSLVYY